MIIISGFSYLCLHYTVIILIAVSVTSSTCYQKALIYHHRTHIFNLLLFPNCNIKNELTTLINCIIDHELSASHFKIAIDNEYSATS